MAHSPPPGAAPSGRPRTIVCDDLSGACELAGVLHEQGRRTVVALGEPCTDGTLNVVDLRLRDLAPEVARQSVATAIMSWDVAYVKIDSLVRGPIAAIVAGTRVGPRRVLVCPALPSAGRTVIDGVPLWEGQRLSTSDAWELEPGAPPTGLAELLDPLPTVQIGTQPHINDDFFRSAIAAESSDTPDRVILCADARTDNDLDRLAALVHQHDLLPVGSAGLFAALGRQCGFAAPSVDDERASSSGLAHDILARGVVVAVGTASVRADLQIDELRRTGVHVVSLDPDAPPPRIPPRALEVISGGGSIVVHWRRTSNIDPARSASMSDQLAELVVDAVAENPRTALVLTGGQTARSVLDRLGDTILRPASLVHHGALVATTDGGRRVAIRPGSFGDRMSLVQLKNAVEVEERKN